MTTTAKAGTSGASSASPTGNSKGAPSASSPAADPANTTQTQTETPRSTRAAIAADIESMQAGSGDDAGDVEADQPGTDETKKAAKDAAPEGDKPSKDDKGKEAERMIPERALKERLGREKKKLDDLKGQLHAKDLEHRKGTEALRLALAEVDRLTALVKQSGKYDEKSEKIAQMELAQKAQAKAQELDQGQQKVIEAARTEAARAIETEALQGEFNDALAAHDLVGFAELKDEYGKELRSAGAKAAQPRSVTEVAAALEQQKLDKARGKLVKDRPAHPTSTRPQRGGGTKSQVDYSHDRKGIAEHIDALQRQHG